MAWGNNMYNVLACDLMTAVDDILQFGVKCFKDLDLRLGMYMCREASSSKQASPLS